MECSWPGCRNAALDVPAPNLVHVPADQDEDDQPVFLCAEHRAACFRALAWGERSPQMRAFNFGLNGGTEEDGPPPGPRSP